MLASICADHGSVFRRGVLAPLLEFALRHRACRELRSDDRGQDRQRDFGATGHRQIRRETPTGNPGEQRIAFQVNDLDAVAQNVAVRRLPWHVDVDQEQQIRVAHVLGRLRSEDSSG